MSIVKHAADTPEMPAFVAPENGAALSFSALDEQSAKLARKLRCALGVGERVALLLDNGASFYVAAWACRRAGLRVVPVNWHLTYGEAAYIVENSDARALIATSRLSDIAADIAAANTALLVLISEDAAFAQFQALSAALAEGAQAPPVEDTEGNFMFYSSGTTGYPKGIVRPLSGAPFGTLSRLEIMMSERYGFDHDTRMLAPAPLYHAAPLAWTIGAQMLGGAVYVPKRFDAEVALACIERYHITHAKFVPTHFVRMLQLPEAVRARYDVSSLRMVIHSAAPCPVDIKDRMISWLGPIVHEYYSMSEGGGFTAIDSHEWLRHKGSVGRSLRGAIHIQDGAGRELPSGEIGHIFFENAEPFEYHKAPEKTAEFFTDSGWSRPGDMGWIDAEGYLYLADRASHMIISGGVNIYPQEIENVLASHPDVFDVAVIGVPDSEYGESVKAIVQLRPSVAGDAATTQALIAHCRASLAGFKCPRSVDFVDTLPRLPNGKLLKRELHKAYWGDNSNLL